MSSFQNHRCYQNWFHLLGLKLLPQKVQLVPYLKNLAKFHLDLRSPKYRNSPSVTYLRINSGRGQNPILEESYLLEYSESEAETFKQCSLGIYLRLVKVSAPEPYQISRYSESTKTTKFILLGFSGSGSNQGLTLSKFYPTKNFDLGL